MQFLKLYLKSQIKNYFWKTALKNFNKYNCIIVCLLLQGILGNVTLNGSPLGPWRHTGYPLTNVSSIPAVPTSTDVQLPAFYSGTFQLPNHGQPPSDTFVDMTGWGKVWKILYDQRNINKWGVI